MKKLGLMLMVFLSVLTYDASARRINIPNNTHISNGDCNYTVTGWVEVTLFPPRLDHCDLTLTAAPPCPNYHFTSLQENPNPPNPVETTMYNWVMNLIENLTE